MLSKPFLKVLQLNWARELTDWNSSGLLFFFVIGIVFNFIILDFFSNQEQSVLAQKGLNCDLVVSLLLFYHVNSTFSRPHLGGGIRYSGFHLNVVLCLH